MLAGTIGRLRRPFPTLLLLGAFLGACAQPEVVLEGDRLDVRTPTSSSVSLDRTPTTSVTPAQVGAPRQVASWGHRGHSVTHVAPHVPLSLTPSQIWSVNIGQGDEKRARVTTDPVSDGVRIYVIDSAARLSAVSTSGQVIWTADLTPPAEQSGLVSGGGLAVANGVLYATSPYGTLTAFNAVDGRVLWLQRLDAFPSGPPAVSGGVVYQITRDNRAWALEADTGRIRWQVPGLAATAGFAGGSGPAIGSTFAVFPFSSGELIAVLRQGGARMWSGSVSGGRIGRVYGFVGDFPTDPVIAGSNVYAGTQAGRMVSIELNSGRRNWTAPIGALGPLQISGNSIWVMSDEGELSRINRSTGALVWSTDLPYFTTEKVRRRKGIHAHYGPILAGGRLLLASSDGYIRSFNPTTGAMISQLPLPSGATASPIVVGQTLYIITQDGALRAFR